MSKVEILIGIVVLIYAIYIYQVYKDSGKKAAFEKLKEHIVVGGGTVAVFAASILLTKALSRWIGLASAAAKLFIWLVIIVVIPLLIFMILFPKRKK